MNIYEKLTTISLTPKIKAKSSAGIDFINDE